MPAAGRLMPAATAARAIRASHPAKANTKTTLRPAPGPQAAPDGPPRARMARERTMIARGAGPAPGSPEAIRQDRRRPPTRNPRVRQAAVTGLAAARRGGLMRDRARLGP